MKYYKIDKLSGTCDELYLTVGKIAMSEKARKYFDNYPVITTDEHYWFVAKDGEKICGFAAVHIGKTVFQIRNVYLDDTCPHQPLFKQLVGEVLKDFYASDYTAASVFVRNDDIPNWEFFKFEMSSGKTNWSIMNLKK